MRLLLVLGRSESLVACIGELNVIDFIFQGAPGKGNKYKSFLHLVKDIVPLFDITGLNLDQESQNRLKVINKKLKLENFIQNK